MERNQIYVISGTEYKDMTRQILEVCNLAELIGDRKTRIGIKPNLVSASEASYGATTHPEIVEGIIEYLQDRGFENIVMLESSWVGGRTKDAYTLCGYDQIEKKYHVPFWDLQKDHSFSKDCAGMTLKICSHVKDIDFLINVPVVKGHCQTKITCALKNLKGLIPGQEKRRFHSLGLHKPIAHLNAGIRQDFIVADNICGDLDFEDGGSPVVMNRILAGLDPVLMDAYVCHLMHYDVDEVLYIKLAEKLGVGCADISKADICPAGGSPADNEAVISNLPLSRKVVEVKDNVEEVESCSACYGYLIPALTQLKEEGLLPGLREKICIGQGFRGRTGTLGVGHCTALFKHHLEGCPPTENQIYDFLKQYIDR